jgi:hypothetical protein
VLQVARAAEWRERQGFPEVVLRKLPIGPIWNERAAPHLVGERAAADLLKGFTRMPLDGSPDLFEAVH